MKILAHTSFIGTTGYNNHARSFFCALNKLHTVKVRNLTVGDTWKEFSNRPHDTEPYITDEMKDMLILQSLYNADGTRTDYPMYDYKGDFKPDINIILNDTHNPYFYDNYEGYTIAYNVWESTRYPDDFFQTLHRFDEVWVPTQWQFDCLVEQGYPKDKISIVTEGVDVETFKPADIKPKSTKFRFLLFGRWEYRKATTEIIRTFGETFKDNNKVELICSVENKFPYDGTKSTEERIEKHNLHYKNVKYVKFPSRKEYVKYLKEGHIFVSCSRSEGWNLPLCIPEGKLIFCNNNFIPIEDVQTNDEIISHTGAYRKILKTFKREYNDDIIKIDLYGDHELLELTPEHPIYGIKRNKFITKKDRHKNIPKISPEWIAAKDIEKGDIILRTTIPQNDFENKIFDMINLDNTLEYNNTQVWYKMGYSQNGELRKYNRYINLWDLSFLFGWYIAEGCDGKSKLFFTLNAKKEIDIAKKLISEINRIFDSYGHYVIKDNKIIVTFSSKLLCKFFTYFCGRMSYNKKIPAFILSGPLMILEDLLENMVLGDGCFLEKHNNFYYSTVSQILSRQLLFANQRMGIKSNIQKSVRPNRNNKPCYNLSWSNNNENGRHSNKSWNHPEGMAILVRNVRSEKYLGFVYNLEVETDNSYLLSNATVHNCEALSCGTPAIYSNWGAQLQFAKDKGIPVKIKGLIDPHLDNEKFVGEFCEPDFEDLAIQMENVHKNYGEYKKKAVEESKIIHEEFNWDRVAKDASDILEKRLHPVKIVKELEEVEEIKESSFVFVTAGNLPYMPVIEKLVQSINEFSKANIIVYGVDCDVPFDYSNLIKKRINPPKYSEHDKWYWKQYACIESIKENYENFVWIDGDAVINYNFDTIEQYFTELENYPLSDIHINEEFSGYYQENGESKPQLFNQKLCELWNITPLKPQGGHPYMHVCMFIYNKSCKWWFEELISHYYSINLKDYGKYFLWNDESIDNAMRWKYGYKKHLPNSNFDTSSYDGDFGFIQKSLHQFYKFWNEDGPQNFNRIYGYQYIVEDKSKIIWFHGNKNIDISDKMIEFIKFQRDKSLYKSMCFYIEVYKLENYESVYEIEGSTMDVVAKYGWNTALFHEIFNLKEYYLHREKKIHDGDIVVDVGANIGVFTRWAYREGASKVISFEPDNRYFELLKLNSDPRSILFHAAISDKMGMTTLYESSHLGGSNILGWGDGNEYIVRTYTLDYLFETGLVDKIDFLKVDIEGAEHEAFRGISDQNLMRVKTIAMEYHHSHRGYNEELRTNFIKRLNNLGFSSHLLFLGSNNALQMLYFSR